MNVRMKKLRQEIKNRESAIKDFIVTNVKTKTSYANIAQHDNFAEVHQNLKNSDINKPIVMNDLIHANERTNFMKITKYLLDKGLPYNFSEFSIYHFKLPSSDPHPALHFLWKNQTQTQPSRQLHVQS